MQNADAFCAADRGGRDTHEPSDTAHGRRHQLEGLAGAIPWGFESPLPHQSLTAIGGTGQIPHCGDFCGDFAAGANRVDRPSVPV